VLLKHPKFSDVKIDLNVLNEIILSKTYLKLDLGSNHITLNIKVPRDTLVIRGLPDHIAQATVQTQLTALLTNANQISVEGDDQNKISLKKELNNNYIVQFNSESMAKDAFFKLKNTSVAGHRFKCELKTNTLFRTTSLSELQTRKETVLPL
jgi:hypothetical protein